MPSHVLIVEDERDLQRVIAYNLKQAGFDVVSAHDGETALRAVREERFDLVILDLMLPDLPGTEICRRLKQNKETAGIPVIMVTAKGEEIDRIVGFELGADDYVVKPFSVRELILRVRAVLRRAEGRASRPSGWTSASSASTGPRTAPGSPGKRSPSPRSSSASCSCSSIAAAASSRAISSSTRCGARTWT